MDNKFVTVDMVDAVTRTVIFSQEVPTVLLVQFVLTVSDFDPTNQNSSGYGFLIKDSTGTIVRRLGLA